FFNEQKGRFEFDPYVKTVGGDNGFNIETEQGYLEQGQYGATLQFAKTEIDSILNTVIMTAKYDLAVQQQAGFIGVTFNDDSVKNVLVSGGRYDVYAVIKRMTDDSDVLLSRQTIKYDLAYLSRKAGVNANVTHKEITGSDGKKQTVYYKEINGQNYQIFNGITANVFAPNVLEKHDNVWMVNPAEINKELKVYKFIGQSNVSDRITQSIFKSPNSSFVFYVYTEDFVEPISYEYGKYAAAKVEEDTATGKKTYYLTGEEITGYDSAGNFYKNGLMMTFKMDTTFSINYRGTDIQFGIRIPGYALGATGQQDLNIAVTTAEQYISLTLPGMKYGFSGNAADAETSKINYSGSSYIFEGKVVDIYGYGWLSYYQSVIEHPDFDGQYAADVIGDVIYLYDEKWGNNIETREGYSTQYVISYNVKTGMLTVESPYYFISRGGLQMPDYTIIYAGSKAIYEEMNAAKEAFANGQKYGGAEGMTEWLNGWTKLGELDQYFKYQRNGKDKYNTALWSGSSSNRVAISYDDTRRTTAYAMSIDDQSVRMSFNVVPWLFKGTEDDVTAFRSTEKYGEEDIIMMPTASIVPELEVIYKNSYNTQSKSSSTVYDDESVQIKFDEEYGYRLHYELNNTKYFIDIKDIDGGGTSRSNVNKWNFRNVRFNTGTYQYATIMLGGRGGQIIKWEFTSLSDRKVVNTNIPSVITVSQDRSYELPVNLVMYYGNNNKTPNNIYIPISYTEITCLSSNSARTADGKLIYDTGAKIKVDGEKKIVYTDLNLNTTSRSQALVYKKEDTENSQGDKISDYWVNRTQLGTIEWSIATRCAYPNSVDDIGGKIILSTYGDKAEYFFNKTMYAGFSFDDIQTFVHVWNNNLTEHDITNTNVDGEHIGFNMYRTDTGEPYTDKNNSFKFSNANIGDVPLEYRYSDESYEIRRVGSTNSYSTTKEKSLVLEITQGTKFDAVYLPIMSINYNWRAESDLFGLEGVDNNLFENPIKTALAWIFGRDKVKNETETTTIMIPWQNAEVTDQSGSYLGGIEAIDTSKYNNRFYVNVQFPIGSYEFDIVLIIKVTR
ncbi:MAG: hypothetical protein J6A99_05005, partial [Clostridia bacterium]|nr:hypothetical protein [Clostridia bacterium]